MSYLELKKMRLGTLISISEVESLLEYLNAIAAFKLKLDNLSRLHDYVNRSIIHHTTKGDCTYYGDDICDQFFSQISRVSSKSKFDESRGVSCDERDYILMRIKDILSNFDTTDYEWRDDLSKSIYDIVDNLNLGNGMVDKVKDLSDSPNQMYDYITLTKNGNQYILHLEDLMDDNRKY